MNKQPVYYMQTDARWKNTEYSAPGEKTTIGRAGCGPTCAAMLIETMTGKTFTPADACAWALKKGYKSPNQGTYYSYFVPQFQAFNIKCERLNTVNLYGNSYSAIHARAFELLKQGYYLIVCMGKGLWTSSGHYIVVWWEDGKVRINDPASTKSERLNGDLNAFKSQVKYYWAIDAREFNKEDDEVFTQEQFNTMMGNYLSDLANKEPSAWSKESRDWAEKNGIIIGDENGNKQYKKFVTREELIQILYNNEVG